MERFDLGNIFQGISTLLQADPAIMYARIGLILLGILLVYLGRRGVLEPLVMIPMGLGMAAVNAGVLIFPGGMHGNLFLDPMVTETAQLMNILQIDFLQPIYTFTFSNGLIACLIFMGIGTMLDINFVLAKPLQSMFLALCAELGTFAVLPIAYSMGLSPSDSASIAMVGGADGPMVLFTSLNLSKEIFVPITVVAYLYLGLTYGGYPYLVRAMVPKRLRAIKMKPAKKPVKQYSAATKISFAVVMCVILCLLFPVAAPLFFSLFIGVVIKESGLKHVNDFISGPMLYGSTFFLGILLGVVFVFAAVLIIYYKQISEGYEDQARFEIMQKVGMTETDIRRSVNSQVLTVFFLPLIMAGIHLAFAFPMVHKLLLLFSLTNLKLLLIVTVCCYLVFAVFYMMVYRITSKGYYHIVSMWAEKK